MPSLRMKSKLCEGCLKIKSSLRVCEKSNMISKRTCPHIKVPDDPAELDDCIKISQEVLSSTGVTFEGDANDEATLHEELPSQGSPQLQKLPSLLVSPTDTETTAACPSVLETIFSPIMEHIESRNEPSDDKIAAQNCKDLNVPELGIADGNDIRSSCYQTCDISDFYISDMIITSLPFNGSDDINGPICFPDIKCYDSSVLFDVSDQSLLLPLLEDTFKINSSYDAKRGGDILSDDNFCEAIEQMKAPNHESDVTSDSDQAECFDPQLFMKSLPELSDVVSSFQPDVLPTESQKRKSVTLVLDLDETLVHSTLEHQRDADFSFTVFFNMKEHIVCVKERPYLHLFLERVAEMFDIVIFTASQSIYAEKVLDRLDPEGRIISRRVYRESCIFSDGNYTKDLTVLGIDLAKVVIIDNNPQVFRLQVNNGIPIKSWFDDPLDCALISLLPFLETLVDADDVRPVIAKRFGNKE